MSGIERIRDFLRWLGEIQANLGGSDAPRQALALDDGAPVLMQRSGATYTVARPAKPGDRGPIYLSDANILSASLKVSPEAAIYGPSAARIEAAKASPFPLEDGAFALAPDPDGWSAAGAVWTLVAAPAQRIEEVRAALSQAGARPGDAFAMAGGRALRMHAPARPRLTLIAAGLAAVAAIGAALSVHYGAASIEAAAQTRLAEARKALSEAEARAAAAQARREDAAGPLRQAQIVGAALDQAPSVVGRLGALAAATPDNAYLKRLNIRPELITGEFISPDAASLAVKIGGDPAFASARLKGAARAEAETQQRATLDILPRAGQ